MATSVYANPQERHLDSKNISVALDELERVLQFGGRVTCNLSSSGLALDCVLWYWTVCVALHGAANIPVD